MYYFSLDDVKCTEKKFKVAKRPSFPTPQKNYEEYDLKGKNGKYYVDLGTYEDIVFEVECNYIELNINEWAKKWRSIKKWIFKEHDYLSFSDDGEYVYKIKKIEISENERRIKQSGEFTITFTCEAYSYLKEGIKEKNINDVLQNDYEISCPIYKVKGNGTCVLNVNGHQVSVIVDKSFNIDTQRQIAYNDQLNSLNDKILVDYEDLYLIEGLNAISISNGFELKIIPNWREL